MVHSAQLDLQVVPPHQFSDLAAEVHLQRRLQLRLVCSMTLGTGQTKSEG